MKLSEILDPKSGVNLANKQYKDIVYKKDLKELQYDYDDIVEDLERRTRAEEEEDFTKIKIEEVKDKYRLNKGDLVFGLRVIKAGIVSERNAGKILTSNYVKLEVRDRYKDKVEPWYICYLLNEVDEVRNSMGLSQSEKEGADGSATVKRLTKTDLMDVELGDLPDFEVQNIVGKLYGAICRREYAEKIKAKLTRKKELEDISKILKGEEY